MGDSDDCWVEAFGCWEELLEGGDVGLSRGRPWVFFLLGFLPRNNRSV